MGLRCVIRDVLIGGLQFPGEPRQAWFDKTPAIEHLTVQCVILKPLDGEHLVGPRVAMGYVAGHGRPIAYVEVSLDQGRTWTQAQLKPVPHERLSKQTGAACWCWTFWEYMLPAVLPSPCWITVRARTYYRLQVGPKNVSNLRPQWTLPGNVSRKCRLKPGISVAS